MALQRTLNAVNRLVAALPLFASPVLSLRSEVVGGVSIPEILHFAHRTLCFSPPIEHTPTSPQQPSIEIEERGLLPLFLLLRLGLLFPQPLAAIKSSSVHEWISEDNHLVSPLAFTLQS